jgi:hypothetical protein
LNCFSGTSFLMTGDHFLYSTRQQNKNWLFKMHIKFGLHMLKFKEHYVTLDFKITTRLKKSIQCLSIEQTLISIHNNIDDCC